MPQQVTSKEALADALADALSERYQSRITIGNMLAVAAGASRDTWSFDATEAGGVRHALVLKRDPPATKLAVDGVVQVTHGIDRMSEARLMELAGEAGVPEPEVVMVSEPESVRPVSST